VIYIIIGIYGAFRHPIDTLRAWEQTWRERHPKAVCPKCGTSGCLDDKRSGW
jgi:hypothetical protein